MTLDGLLEGVHLVHGARRGDCEDVVLAHAVGGEEDASPLLYVVHDLVYAAGLRGYGQVGDDLVAELAGVQEEGGVFYDAAASELPEAFDDGVHADALGLRYVAVPGSGVQL